MRSEGVLVEVFGVVHISPEKVLGRNNGSPGAHRLGMISGQWSRAWWRMCMSRGCSVDGTNAYLILFIIYI